MAEGVVAATAAGYVVDAAAAGVVVAAGVVAVVVAAAAAAAAGMCGADGQGLLHSTDCEWYPQSGDPEDPRYWTGPRQRGHGCRLHLPWQ